MWSVTTFKAVWQFNNRLILLDAARNRGGEKGLKWRVPNSELADNRIMQLLPSTHTPNLLTPPNSTQNTLTPLHILGKWVNLAFN